MKYEIGCLIRNRELFEYLADQSKLHLEELRNEKNKEGLLFYYEYIYQMPSIMSCLMDYNKTDLFVYISCNNHVLQLYKQNYDNIYPATIGDIKNGLEKLGEQLWEDPSSDPRYNGSLIVNGNLFSLFPLNGSWFIYANRDKELSVLRAPMALIQELKEKFPQYWLAPNDFYMKGE